MKKFAFRPFRLSKGAGEAPESSSNDKQATSQKRREQVRKAQRTHRERKEIYIKSLETEVLQLRTNEANLLQETRNLYAEISQLRGVLTELGVQLPITNVGTSTNTALSDPTAPNRANWETAALSPNSVVSIRQGSKGPQIHVSHATTDSQQRNDGFQLSANPPTGSWRRVFRNENSQTPEDTSRFQSPVSGKVLSSPNAYESALSASASSPESISEIDMESIGVEFVLTLESPCLEHIQGNPKEPAAPSGHVLTASAPLLFRAPNIETGSHICTTTPWEAPNIGLERLLNLSQSLQLDGEVTPVQAWNYIRRHPKFEGLEMERLRALTGKLLKEVNCHGFGAVVEQVTFETLVFNALVVGKVF